jgi:ELWxxDGT repeat protein
MRLSAYIFSITLFTAALTLSGCELFGAGGGSGSSGDGAEAPTVSMVRDINPGSGNSNPNYFESLDGTLYFAASSSISERNLWKTDGTSPGTVRASELTGDAALGSSPSSIETYNGRLFMSANAGSEGYELMSYSEENGAKLVEDINSNSVSGGTESSYPDGLTTKSFLLGPKLLFFSAQADSGNRELWAYDGNSPYKVKEINGSGSSDPDDFATGSYQIYFSADGGSYGIELWTAYYSTDVMGNGYVEVERLSDIASGSEHAKPKHLTLHSGTLYFSAFDSSDERELYYYETDSGAIREVDVNPSGSSSPKGLIVYKGKLIFGADGGNGKGRELWSFSLSTGQVSLLKEINSGSEGSNPSDFVEYKDRIYFQANDGSNGTELWVTDGTGEGTELFRDLNGGGSSSPRNFYVFDEQLYFAARNGSDGEELWTLDVN